MHERPGLSSSFGKRDSIHHHLLEVTSETATAPDLRRKPLYATPSGWRWRIDSVFRQASKSGRGGAEKIRCPWKIFVGKGFAARTSTKLAAPEETTPRTKWSGPLKWHNNETYPFNKEAQLKLNNHKITHFLNVTLCLKSVCSWSGPLSCQVCIYIYMYMIMYIYIYIS